VNHNSHAAAIGLAKNLPQQPDVLGIVLVNIGIAEMQFDTVV
jgi:hypothetical protein